MSWDLSITKLYVMKKSKITFDEMPQLMASLITEVRSLRRTVDLLSTASLSDGEPRRRVLSTDEVCGLLGRTRVSIYRMIRRGELAAYKKGKNLFFFEDEILSGLESGRIRSRCELQDAACKRVGTM